MILAHPATLGVIAWLLVTAALIVGLAGRSVSAVFGISTSLVRGIREWAGRPERDVGHGVSPKAVELPALPAPRSPAGSPMNRTINAGAAARWREEAREAEAELEDLDVLRLP